MKASTHVPIVVEMPLSQEERLKAPGNERTSKTISISDNPALVDTTQCGNNCAPVESAEDQRW